MKIHLCLKSILLVAFFFTLSNDANANVSVRKGIFPTMCPGGAYVTQTGTIMLREGASNDFQMPATNTLYTYFIGAPAGFEFKPGVGSISVLTQTPDANANDFNSNVAIEIYTSYILLKLTSDGTLNNETDSLYISNLQMRALSSATSGSLTRMLGGSFTTPNDPGSFGDLTTSALPSAPTVSDNSRCGAGNITFSPSGSTTYNLYDAATAGSLLNSGGTVTTFVNSTTTYYVSAVNATGCESSSRTAVQGIINSSPSISSNPGNQAVCQNAAASFSAAATGTGLTYQWQENTGSGFNNISNGGIYSGATSSTLVLTGVTAGMNNYFYQCVVSGTCASPATSGSAALFVTPSASISAHPSSVTKCVNDNGPLSVTVSGTSVTYQWQVDDGSGSFTNLVDDAEYGGVTTNQLWLNSVDAIMNGYRYRCKVGASCTSDLYSNSATLTVNTPINISSQPVNKSICEGDFTTFSVSATGTNLGYSWYKKPNAGVFAIMSDGGNFFGTSTSTLFVAGPPSSESNSEYYCVISGGCGNINTNNVTLTVNGVPTFSAQPSSITRCVNGSGSFSVTASNVSAYKWQVNTGSSWTDLTNDATYNGVATSTLSVSNVTLAMHLYAYRCVISGTCTPPATSEQASLSITQASPDFTGLNSNYCINGDSTQLVGTPTGGSFSGSGIYNAGGGVYWFNPRNAGAAGSKNITYTYTQSTCNFTKVRSTTIINKPTVNFTGLSAGYSEVATSVPLNATGTPSGGGFSFGGTAVSGTTFNPSAAGIGTHILYAYYIDQNNCKDTVSASVQVVPQSGSIIGLESSYCRNSPNDTIYGIKGAGALPGSGYWYVSGYVNTYYPLGDTALVIDFYDFATGPVYVTFGFYDNFGSNFETYGSSFVTEPPSASFNSGVSFCQADAAYTLIGSPSGGTFSGTGVTFSGGVYRFNPQSFSTSFSGAVPISYSYVNSTNGCRSIPDPYTASLSIFPTPVAPVLDTLSVGTATRIQRYCQGDSRVAWQMQASSSTFFWYSDAAFTSLISSGATFSPIASTSIVGTTSYFVRGYNGSCFGPALEVVMVVNPKAFSNAGSDKIVCEGTANIDISTGSTITGSASSASWSRVPSGGTFPLGTTYGGSRSYTPNAADILAGQVQLVLATNDPDGTGPCSVERDTVLIRINPKAVVNAGTNQLVCQSIGTVFLSTGISISGGTQTGVWTREGGGGTFPDGTSYSHTIQNQIRYTLSAADIAANGVNLILTTSDPDGTGPCSVEDDTVRVTINKEATANAGSNKVVCAGSTQALSTVPFAASVGGTASSFSWTGGAGSFSVSSGSAPTANTIYTPSLAELNGDTIDLTLTTNDPDGVGPCLAVSSIVNLIINQRATANAGPDTTVCAGANSSATMIALTASVGGSAASYSWSGGTGSFLPPSGIAPDASTIYTPAALELTNATPFKLYLSANDPDGAGPCQVVKDSMVVTINRRAVVSAGADKVICEGTATVNLSPGASISGGTTNGTWSKVGAVGTFTPSNVFASAARFYNPITDDTTAGVNIVLTSLDPDGSGPCLAVTDTLFIQVNKAALVFAGADQTVCAGATGAQTQVDLSSATLSGSSSSATWSGGLGAFLPGSIVQPNATTVLYQPDVSELSPGGLITLRLTTNDPDGTGPCQAAKDSMYLTINPRAVVSAGLDKIVCENTGNVIIYPSSSISGGITTGYWERSGGGGTYVPNATYDVLTRYQLDATDIANGFVDLVLISDDPDGGSGPCTAETDTMSISIRYLPIVNAGTDSTVCAGDTTLSTFIYLNDATITLNGSSYSGSWSGGAGYYFPNSATINARYVPHASELISGTPVTLTLTSSDPAGPCGSTFDSKAVTINPRLFVNAGIDQSICTDGPQVSLTGSVIKALAPSAGVWSAPRGTFDDATNLGTTFHVNPLDIPVVGAPQKQVVLTLTGLDPDGPTGPCTSEKDSMTVIVYSLPTVSVSGLAASYCQKPGTLVSVNGSPLNGASGSGFTLDPDSSSTALGGANGTITFVPETYYPSLHKVRYRYVHPSTTCANFKDTVIALRAYPFPKVLALDSCATRSVHLIDSTKLRVGNITSFDWEFGDGVTTSYTTKTNPVHTYGSPNNFNIKLTVTTDYGCVNSTSKLISIGSIPKTDFKWGGVCPADVTSFFDLSGFTSSEVRDYFWRFNTAPGDTTRGNTLVHKNPTFDYSTVGQYLVTFTVTSKHQCDSTMQKYVNILPYAAPTSTNSYVEDFNANNGNWAVSGKNPSWEYGIPTGKSKIVHPSNNVWITKLSGVYNVDEKSYLDGPCFNFTDLDRPMVSLKIWSATQQQIAGATLEASQDGGNTWERVGAVGDGIKWYDYANVIGNPGNQSIAQGAQAWTGQYLDWQVAKIGLPRYAGSPSVRLRIAFGSGLDSLGLADGFALDSVHVGQKSKVVLLEHFTNSNVSASLTADGKIDTIRSSRPQDVAVVNYHTSAPFADAYSSYNFSDPGARVLYYGVSTPPLTVMDGNVYVGSTYSLGTDLARLDTSDVDSRSLESSIFDISLNTMLATGQLKVGAFVRCKDTTVLSHGVVLHLAVVEDNAGGNPNMDNVLRKMLPDAVGNVLSNWDANKTISVYQTYNHTLPGSAELGVVAYIQDLSTKEIYQTAYISGSGTVGDDFVDATLDAHLSQWDVKVFPNPASESATVFFGGGANQKLTWKLMDEIGQVVDNGAVSFGSEGFEINTSKQSSGIYLLKIEDDKGGSIIRKIVIAQ